MGAAPTGARPGLALLAAVVVVMAALGPMPVKPAHAAVQTEVVLDGKGYGHGVGMAQDGAYALGVAGKGTEEILATFYPGTSLGEGGGTINVSLDSPQPAIELAFPAGGVLDASGDSRGFPVAVAPGGSVRLSTGGGLYHAEPLAGAPPSPTTPPPTTTAPPTTQAPVTLPGDTTTTPPPTTPPPPPPPSEPTSTGPLRAVPRDGSTVAVAATGRRYRGVVRVGEAGGGLQLVNQIDVEEYLRGMGEIREPGWPAASLQTQAIAARTYALRSAGATLCSTDQCQVYLGQTAEYGAMDAAVAATRGVVVRYGGALADTVYSANGGGFTATPQEGFGDAQSDTPYLKAVPYASLDPEPWTVRSTLAEMAGRFGYGGAATGARVSRTGPSGRTLEIIFEGGAGPLVVDAQRFETVLKLRSTLFTLRVEEPPPPPDAVGEAAPGGGAQVRVASPPKIVALGGPERTVNRRPWIALALLLFVGSASAATRVRAAVAPTTSH